MRSLLEVWVEISSKDLSQLLLFKKYPFEKTFVVKFDSSPPFCVSCTTFQFLLSNNQNGTKIKQYNFL
jgi:hypothetical protein